MSNDELKRIAPMLYDMELMNALLCRCCDCVTAGLIDEAWDWYAVFTSAWNRLGKSRLDGVPGYTNLRENLRLTQAKLQESKKEGEICGA